MLSFLIFEGKVALALLTFYLFYRFLLKKETFHRFNRVVLVGTAVLSFLLPLCIITIHKPMELAAAEVGGVASGMTPATEAIAATSQPWWTLVLSILFFAGVASVLVRLIVSILSIIRIVRNGKVVDEEDGSRIIVTERDIDPFSWMRYIVLSRKDWEGQHAPVIVHEKAHIEYGHSVDLLLVDLMSAFQWFNPAMWMLRADLQELHEYEADDAVLRSGANIKDYQYLLIRKAVSKSGYSVANSFNHSILKNRITMMSKSKSPLRRGLRVLYLLPLVCLGIGLQAKTVFVPVDKGNEIFGESITESPGQGGPLYILRQGNEEKEITKAEFDKIDKNRISKIDILKDDIAKEKYGDRGADGVIVISLKRPQELEESVPFALVSEKPTFNGGDAIEFSHWVNEHLKYPESAKKAGIQGRVVLSFTVDTDGYMKDIRVLRGVHPDLDAEALRVLSSCSEQWTPGIQDGQPVKVTYTFPVIFQLK